MLIELPPDARGAVRPLCAGFPGLRGARDAALEGTAGRVWADDRAQPRLAVIKFDFDFLAGDPDAPAAEEAARLVDVDGSIVVSSPAWEPLLRRVWGERLTPRTRVEFEPGEWDRARLRAFVDALPEGFALTRIGRAEAERFEALAASLVYNFTSLADFVARGVGFGIEHEGRFVSGCSSFAVSSRSLEFEIQTHPDFRRRGLACAAAAAMIGDCLERGLEPCWDAHNELSAALATKLGFVDPQPYTSYELRPRIGETVAP